MNPSRRTVQRLGAFASQAPVAARLPPHELIRALRTALRMTQAQLARRASMPQSHVARLESGRIDPQLGTLRKVLDALFCDLLTVPRMRRTLGDVLKERIQKTARRNVVGATAPDQPQPDGATLRSLIRAEESRLRALSSSNIWAD